MVENANVFRDCLGAGEGAVNCPLVYADSLGGVCCKALLAMPSAILSLAFNRGSSFRFARCSACCVGGQFLRRIAEGPASGVSLKVSTTAMAAEKS